MNLSRKLLIRSTILLIVIGLTITFIPFFSSLSPTEKAGESLPTIDVSKLQPNEYKIVEIIKSRKEVTNDSTRFKPGTSLLVIRDVKKDYYVYQLPTWDEEVLMPGPRYWYVIDEGSCKDFRPEILDEKINSNSKILCFDPNPKSYFSKHWKWELSGKNISKKLPDLLAIKYIKQGDVLALKSINFN